MIEKKEIKFAKNIDDVMALIVGIITVIKEKGEYTDLIGELVAAVTGLDEIDDEFKADKIASFNTVLLRSTEMIEILSKKEEKEV